LGKERIVLPVDHLVVRALDHPESACTAHGEILPGWIGVDIGPKTIDRFREEIVRAATIVWNGPLGKYEDEPYSNGTREIARALAAARAVTVVGGGETAEAVESFGLDRALTHVSTGGGAFLEYIEGTPFDALAHIDDDKKP
jgi:phosphoglycerate kinase